MRYRTLGRLTWRPSALGFGCMRLPVIGDDRNRIDEPEATRMIRQAIDRGVNYLDTAYPYHGGNSEAFVGRALRDGYRERVKLATKMPVWLIEKREDMDRYLAEQLARLGLEKVDFYLFHSLDRKGWGALERLGALDWAERARAAGKFDFLGFSFHDDLDCFKAIVAAHDRWDICQIQYNYLDVAFQAGTAGLRHAAARGLGVVIMEPLRGGLLAGRPPESVAEVWGEALHRHTLAEWALLWLWNQPEVSVVLSGMSTMDQVLQNIGSAELSGTGALSRDELALIERVRLAYERLRPVNCTGCEYCQPCPHGVVIAQSLQVYNQAVIFGALARFRDIYGRHDPKSRPDACLACGECEAKCPQHLPIPDLLKEVHRVLGEGQEPRAPGGG